MNSKRLSDNSPVGIRVGASKQADIDSHANGTKIRDMSVASADSSVLLACTNGPTSGSVLYTIVLDDGSLREVTDNNVALNGTKQEDRRQLDMKKTICGGHGDQKDAGPSGVLKRASPTHCLILNGHKSDGLMQCDTRLTGKHLEVVNGYQAAQGQTIPPEERHPLSSSHIPVPRHRKLSGHADKEVMAATVLTSLSTSPLVLNPASATTAATLEAANRGWKEALSASYSSSTSGNWSWDASDQSVPSTPSPPLSNDTSKSFLLSFQGDDIIQDVTEITHFLFEDPIPRKRKNSMKVMFKCLWKNCEKVLSTSSGIQRHIRTVHLGRNVDSDYSDGEEDFYYSEIEVNMDSLSEGLSSLTPTSPTTAGPPPVFPLSSVDVPHSEPSHISIRGGQSHLPSLLSQSAPSTLCHIRTDHAYQATAPVSIPVCSELAGPASGRDISVSWQSTHTIFKGLPGPLAQVRSVSIGEKRQPAPNIHTTVSKSHASTALSPKPTLGTRKPRGEAKKCRKVYGMEKRDMWCTACRWKKACQRFTD
ncbi:zinc finger protein 704 isoform X1 [Hypomesus transpacificus]|uniref:zinc finger protein 704 isoform X1 n=1 Tax=Hypomesus transpacificus TaxID=137520 RepID=UPI001F076C75|nr:zinc finger protein 704 isoform X1 [Hypomesus transpacificus]